MAQKKRVIFKVNDLEKNFGSYEALKIKKLEIHPGTIYGIIGTVGSGKSTLLNILAGTEKQSSGITARATPVQLPSHSFLRLLHTIFRAPCSGMRHKLIFVVSLSPCKIQNWID